MMWSDLEGWTFFQCCFDEKGEIEKEFELMQYTGLHDENGIEIYEGDVIKTNEGYCEEGKENIDVVIFSKGMFRTKKDWDDGHYCIGDGYGLDGECYLEIIGNIYQNPKIIKS